MNKKPIACKVKEGRTQIRCTRCSNRREIEVPSNKIEMVSRCGCGAATHVTFDRRASPRIPISRCATVTLPCGHQHQVYLCDMSLGGVGFNLPNRQNAPIVLNQEINIHVPTLAGPPINRTILVKFLSQNRIGGQFIDLLVN